MKATKEDFTEGITKYNAELINLECDYPECDKQYSQILYTLTEEDLIDYENIKWYSVEDEMSDVFFKIFIRLAERKFIASDHDHEELTEFIAKYKFKEILESIKKYLMQENLLKEFHMTLKEDPLS
eukprot:CAMPEP_0205805524 /NCGR_PEP_ID=MMETSP0205-20121125/8777_1 /ASSEMBLY_ACC=CAM_ASM_000278 /TAXON_ID=36767 /ORGANISM="Euplotes focardii, Strain TN1" /LENGTH=125 /DNA_ID=CAMNT_0053076887 /DNA_START=131 /DNA_END=505 /DNA_ORIENTATION=+